MLFQEPAWCALSWSETRCARWLQTFDCIMNNHRGKLMCYTKVLRNIHYDRLLGSCKKRKENCINEIYEPRLALITGAQTCSAIMLIYNLLFFWLSLYVVVGNSFGDWTCSFGLWCLNPAVVFKQIADLSLSVILTSG